MRNSGLATHGLASLLLACFVSIPSAPAVAAVDGIDVTDGTTINLSAGEGYVYIADGGSVYSWGYSNGGAMQLPGPTLLAHEGDTVTVTLTNDLPAAAGNTSILFPGQPVVADTATGVAGALTQEAVPGGTVTYTVGPLAAGTYEYYSGSQSDLQVEMGLYGALIVYPSASDATTLCGYQSDAAYDPNGDIQGNGLAYNHPDTCFDREYLFLLSEIDVDVHQAAERQRGGSGPIMFADGGLHPEYWMINGRAAPDTMAAAGDVTLPAQPYNSFPRMHPGERILLRVVGAGRELHPFHTHGNHSRVLARDGRMLLGPLATGESYAPLAGPLLFTIPSVPGQTVDAIFQWTGKDLGWDMYGHAPGDAMQPYEDPDDHGKPIPVTLPSLSSLAFGGFYSGSPFLGALGSLPPGEGGLNPSAGFTFMWHSHNERELVNNDVFPGGMMTMLVVEAFKDIDGVEIDIVE